MLKTPVLSIALVGACLAVLVATSTPAAATTTAAAKPAKAAKAAPAPAKSKAKPAAAAGAAVAGGAAAAAALSAGQLDAAQRVYTGAAACEFGETIEVAAVDGKPGHFKLTHKAHSYNLVPEETTTGAVRLEDKRAGMVWLQIPSKSMLMNAKLGQRVVDNCQMSQQRG